MPKLLRVNNIGASGINSDLPPWSLPPEYITDGFNFRAANGSLLTAGGYADWSFDPSFNAGYLAHIPAASTELWLVAGRNRVYAYNTSIWDDITSAATYSMGAGDELLWTGCTLGNIPVINNPSHYPEYWENPGIGVVMQPLPWTTSPTVNWQTAGVSCDVMRNHKQYLFALGITEGGVYKPNTYRWSHPADNNAIPFSWDETDPSSLAGEAQIGGDTGGIVDGYSLRDAFCIYSEKGVDMLYPSNDEFVWRRVRLSSTTGLAARNCIIEVKGVHYFLADGDIVKNDGNALVSIVHDRIRNRLVSQTNPDTFQRSYAVRNTFKKEIWFCIPEGDAEYPNVAYVYNWRDDSWAIRDLPYEVDADYVTVLKGVAHAAYGPKAVPGTSWDSWTGTWDEQTGVWGSRRRSPLDDNVIGIDTINSSLKVLDPSDARDSGDLNTFLERTNFPLEGHDIVTTITRVYPRVIGTNPVSIRLGSHDFPGSPVRWKPAVTFDPNTDRKLDIRTTGELHAWRIESVGVGSAEVSGLDFEYVIAGRR